jgi:S-adenosylmethionine synthetase
LLEHQPDCLQKHITYLSEEKSVASGKYLFTSESVSMGHPDKVADQISDSVLDAMLAQDPKSRVACETLTTTNLVVVAGEVTSTATVDIEKVVRNTLREIGYTDRATGIGADDCEVIVRLDKQSPDIAMGVDRDGAGDQGLMFGYACDDTAELMPLPIALSHRILARLNQARFNKEVNWLRPDSKSQVTVEYEGFKPLRIDTVVLSTQHSPDVDNATLRDFIKNKIINPCLPPELMQGDITYHINPTGRFEIGGPHGDCGLTGRKIIVDTYGGWGRHGGGAFSGKDATKVDRSAAYMARHVAKNIVAAGLASRCEVQLAYAIGIADPVSVHVDTQGTGKIDDSIICDIVKEHFPLSTKGIIEYLQLRRPIFRKTAAGGHFGRTESEFTWESTEAANTLAEKAAAMASA